MLAPASNRSVERTDNQPPGPIESAKDAYDELSAFLKEHPVLASQQEAKLAGAWKERTLIALEDAREDRDGRTRPLNEQLREIRAEYDMVREKSASNKGGPLQIAYTVLCDRLTAYATAVEAARIAEANRLREEAEKKERLAREAEANEQEAIANAAEGEATDVGGAIQNANEKFSEFQRADRAADVAEHHVPVRIASIVGGKAISMRTTRVIAVNDPYIALKAMELNAPALFERVKDTIRICAGIFEDEVGALPDGVSEEFKRSI